MAVTAIIVSIPISISIVEAKPTGLRGQTMAAAAL